MPIYKYKCKQCTHEYEQLYTSFSAVDAEEKGERCPKCASTDKERLLNEKTSFQLKGHGWAKDKYGKGR